MVGPKSAQTRVVGIIIDEMHPYTFKSTQTRVVGIIIDEMQVHKQEYHKGTFLCV